MELKRHFVRIGLLLVVSLVQAEPHCHMGYQKNGTQCTDEDECQNEDGLCGNYSKCHNTKGSYYCTCHQGFTSRTPNFTAVSGQCNDSDECEIAPSVCEHGICSNTPGTFTCSCPQGFRNQGNSSAPCIDIDECDSEEHVCGENGVCSNSVGSYHCQCNHGYSNYGNNQTKCTELKCERANSTFEQADIVMSRLLSMLMSTCQSLSSQKEQQPTGKEHTGETLLKELLNVSEMVVRGGVLDQSVALNTFLGVVEDTMHLISPQLNQPLTKIHNNVSEVWLAVRKERTPPNGSVLLSMDDVHLNISWETAVGASYPGYAYVALLSYKGLNSSGSSVRVSEELEKDQKNATYQLNSRMVTALVSNPDTQTLAQPVTLTFKHLQEGAVSEELNYSCVYWEETPSGGVWSGRGCMKAELNSTHAVCTWSHLSSFAVLMALYPIKESFELVWTTRVGLAVSLVCLLVCIFTFRFCRPIQGTRTTIHLHLCVCLFIADLLFLFFISSTSNKGACAFVASLLHFFFLAAFCWMLLEGVQLYRMVVLVFHTTLRPLYMFAVGYGVPLAIVVISAAAFSQGYGTDRHCWLSLEEDFIWSFFAPVCIIIILNSFFFVITIWKLAGKFSTLNPDFSKLKKLRSFVVTAVAQLCVLGGMWVFGCFLFQEQGTLVMSYLFTLLNSLQGALIFIMYCLMSKTVREEYSKLFGTVCKSQKKRYSEFSTNQSSNSQQPLKSMQSTGESEI
ncbi:adhesion G protein-coupled receptor E5 isoform X2 [Electrophorus electricus]|uniref:adhesion G protein-coupled receptor E5 isoform X2 n=1 Tax=Electrophorus electricus TaxID=8005 RepID=UPI0015D0C8A3|nr:adhesion G protein-coupled receptor E5 isoform X2 [Electrophorus electricus]